MTLPRLPRRSAAVLGATALALSGLGAVAGPAAAEARGIDDACTGNTADAGFTDIAYLTADGEDAVNCLVAYALTEGVSDSQYAPAQGVKRYQMALFLHRELAHLAAANTAIAMPHGAGNTFEDVDGLSEEAQTAIDALVAAGITDGRNDTEFDPHAIVTRLDMASFIVRVQAYVADQLADGTAAYSADDSTAEFDDLTMGVPRRDDVYALESVGIVEGTSTTTYAPYAPVTRAQMAFFLTRHLDENIESGRSLAVGQDVVWNSTQVLAYGDLSDAVAAAASGDVLVTMGEFTETERILLDDDGVVVTGRGETVVHGSFEVRSAADVTLDGLLLTDYVTAAGVTAGVYLADVTGVEITNTVFVGGDEGTFAGRGVENETGGAVEGVRLLNNEFYFNVTGVYANPSADYVIDRNVFQQNTAGSVNDADSTIRENVFGSNGEGVGLNSTGSTVAGNLFGANDVHVADYTRTYSLETIQAANGFDADVEVAEGETANLIVDMG
ncbi:S-layer homology domain-containing protein [Quadrisphaera sp. GCM10027208]|uniref:S-layer homology domain-containing protein n=1 Tax=Quadrisphaera sp. GCM10027208 TaxID=3273423 RepID=UPI00360D8069